MENSPSQIQYPKYILLAYVNNRMHPTKVSNPFCLCTVVASFKTSCLLHRLSILLRKLYMHIISNMYNIK